MAIIVMKPFQFVRCNLVQKFLKNYPCNYMTHNGQQRADILVNDCCKQWQNFRLPCIRYISSIITKNRIHHRRHKLFPYVWQIFCLVYKSLDQFQGFPLDRSVTKKKLKTKWDSNSCLHFRDIYVKNKMVTAVLILVMLCKNGWLIYISNCFTHLI